MSYMKEDSIQSELSGSADSGSKLQTVYPILIAICFAHLINDLLQSVIPSMYPLMREKYALSYSEIGLITFTFQITSSLLQPFVGFYTDKRPQPFSFVFGMFFTLAGIIMLSFSNSYHMLLLSAGFVGLGSSVFHPESSKLAYFASGGRRGLAQSIFQLGGNTGSAIGPLLIASIVAVYGQIYILLFTIVSAIGIVVLFKVGKWYKDHLKWRAASNSRKEERHSLSKSKVVISIMILLILIFSKFFYNASMTSYFTFFLIDKFHVTAQQSQFYLFVYLISVAAGTLVGGPIGDRFGRKYVIWFSILGVAPFTLLMPHVGFAWTIILSVIIGFVLSSAFSAIIVYAQELLPGRIGMVSGLFFGFAFGMGGLGAALLGDLADELQSIQKVFFVCSFLPLIGIFTLFLPTIGQKK